RPQHAGRPRTRWARAGRARTASPRCAARGGLRGAAVAGYGGARQLTGVALRRARYPSTAATAATPRKYAEPVSAVCAVNHSPIADHPTFWTSRSTAAASAAPIAMVSVQKLRTETRRNIAATRKTTTITAKVSVAASRPRLFALHVPQLECAVARRHPLRPSPEVRCRATGPSQGEPTAARPPRHPFAGRMGMRVEAPPLLDLALR